jgi:hypothetical protein
MGGNTGVLGRYETYLSVEREERVSLNKLRENVDEYM